MNFPLAKAQAAVNLCAPHTEGPLPLLAGVAFGIVDENGNVVQSGKSGSRTTALTAGATPSFAPSNGQTLFTLTPAENETIAAVGTNAVSGQQYVLKITTSGTSSYTITFGTGFVSKGTLVTGTITAITYTVQFTYDGTNFVETARTRDASAAFALTDATPIALGTAEGLTVYTLTPAQSETINAAVVPRAGTQFRLVVLTSGTSSFTLTFGTNFKSTGTLATGTADAKKFVVSFESDGTTINEVSRTAAQ